MSFNKQEINRISAICAELDGYEKGRHFYNNRFYDYKKNKDNITSYLNFPPDYTADLNEIFRLVREWIDKKKPDDHGRLSKALDDAMIDISIELLTDDNPALALACALVKAEGRWKEVDDED